LVELQFAAVCMNEVLPIREERVSLRHKLLMLMFE